MNDLLDGFSSSDYQTARAVLTHEEGIDTEFLAILQRKAEKAMNPRHALAEHGPYPPQTVIVDVALGMIYRVGGDQATLAILRGRHVA